MLRGYRECVQRWREAGISFQENRLEFIISETKTKQQPRSRANQSATPLAVDSSEKKPLQLKVSSEDEL